MTSRRRDANGRWLGPFLGALTVVLITLLGVGNPSAAAVQTPVGVHLTDAAVVVEAHGGIATGQQFRDLAETHAYTWAAGVGAEDPVAAAPRLVPEYVYDGGASIYDASVRCVHARTVTQIDAVAGLTTEGLLEGPSSAVWHGSVLVSGFVIAAESGAARGLNGFGGVMSETRTNAAGGRVFTSTGTITQNHFAGIVNSGLMRGDDAHILTGAHGAADGSMVADAGMYVDDVRTFGHLPA